MRAKFIVLFFILSFNLFADPVTKSHIEKPFYDVQRVEDGFKNHFTLIEEGRVALYKRLDLIQKAEKSIEVEYFIFALDEAGKLLSQELINAAKRGVKVRVLVDASLTILKLDKFHAKLLSDNGVEVKLYNTAKTIQISSIQFRNHRKLLVVDDKFAITGGRNVENDYYDLSHHYNFLDRDVYLEGPIVKTMRESFDAYFNHKISKHFKEPKLKKSAKKIQKFENKMHEASDLIENTPELEELKNSIMQEGIINFGSLESHVCPVTTYITDLPGGNFFRRLKDKYTDKYRGVRKALYDKLLDVNKSVYISSPYLLNNRHSRRMMKSLLARNIDMTLYTNSLASTDAIYVAANLYDPAKD